MVITSQQLIVIIGNKFRLSDLDLISSSFNQTCEKYQINTRLRVCHFLAQILHESGCFKYTEELASGDAYDTRTDLGNTPEKDGDGRRYKGRGYIQITGTTNYKLISKAFGYDFFADPEALEKQPWNMLSAGWYWNTRGLNKYADQDDIFSITKKINGGTNGLADREAWLTKTKSVIK